ncbi:MAG: ribonuclease H-like domain-containing protein [Lachnospiraceae bacterium]|nr:ribonuclease H-like domain-containing protein [Lachnospiraceae bacterium]
MEIIKKQISMNVCHGIEEYFPGKNILYFDIETTGLSSSRGMIYLIGTAWRKEDSCYEIHQYFAYNAIDEKDLILEFVRNIQSFDILVSFNGDNFDLPFLKKRAEYLGLSVNILNYGIVSVDIYRKIRKYCGLLGMENAKQKTVEKFLGIQRKDTVSGKELIKVYRDYLVKRDEHMRDILLLHNSEDVTGLPVLSGMISYCGIFEGNWEISGMETVENGILIVCTLKNKIQKALELQNSFVRVWILGEQVRILLYTVTMELKFFYPDYKNYYYLPKEDMAVHKSVAAFVDKEYRIKAAKENCYMKRSGEFVKNYGLTSLHILKRNYSENEEYVEAGELITMDIQTKEFREYVIKLLNSFIKRV